MITRVQKKNLETWIEAVKSSKEKDIELIIKATAAQVWSGFNDERATGIYDKLKKPKLVVPIP